MKQITTAQLKIIHVLLRDLNIVDKKPDLVFSFTEGRTESSKEMALGEAKTLIEYLKGREAYTMYINRVWYLAYETGIINKGDREEIAMNAADLDIFCLKRGTVKKRLREQSVAELKKTVRQFEAMYKKYSIKAENKKEIAEWERSLSICISDEQYEIAAMIQQKINELKKLYGSKRTATTA